MVLIHVKDRGSGKRGEKTVTVISFTSVLCGLSDFSAASSISCVFIVIDEVIDWTAGTCLWLPKFTAHATVIGQLRLLH
jgi:hypothetical protein